jgi:hypothetical protein
MPRPINGYKINGEKVPGVTTILSRFKESGGLLHWAFEQGKACQRGEIESLYDKRDEAASAGTLAHAMVEAHINGTDSPDISQYPEEIVKQAQQGFNNYIEWSNNNCLRVTHQETELVSKSYRFGGCVDAVGKDIQDRTCLIDWKTSNSVYSDYMAQLGAYRILWDENNPNDPITGGYHLLRFSKEHADFTHHYWSNIDEACDFFLLLRKAYDLDRLLKKRV